MKADTIIKYFERISEAPDAVIRLRRFILDLAVRGKLAQQDPNDEPAAELLKRILGEKTRKKTTLQEVELGELLFDLPSGWAIARFGNVLTLEYGTNLPSEKRSNSGECPVYGSNGVVGSHFEPLVNSPCIVVGRKGSAGALNLALVERCWITDVAYYCVPPIGLDLVFTFILLQTLDLDRLGKGVKPGLSRTEAYVLPIAIPPLAEQLRIVAKVDELMALCDQLAAAQNEREALCDRLVATSLHKIAAANATSADVRFHLDHLPQLTTRPEHIKQLRHSIINLAIRGRLVAQDSTDEPAAEVLKKIQNNKALVLTKGKKEAALPSVDTGAAPFDLPRGWAWARFPEVGTFGRGKSKHRPRNDSVLFEGGTHFLIQTGDVARSKGLITTYVNKYNEVGLAQSMKWPSGTLCITIAANIADTGILSFDACFPDSVVGFVPDARFPNARYFEYFMRTAKANLLQFAPATAQKNINLEILNSVLIPLPPVAEQKRIVAKIDELMELCDRLEAQLVTTETESRRLLKAVLQDATDPDALRAKH